MSRCQSFISGAYLAICVLLAPQLCVAREVEECLAKSNPEERLRCYDEVHRYAPQSKAIWEPRAVEPDKISLWKTQLDEQARESVFTLYPYKPNYVLLSHLRSSPHAFGRNNPYQRNELKFQLSLSTKIVKGDKVDWWLAYTQDSYWQVFNGEISRPFRETNHQPEIFASIRPERQLFGLSAVNVGLLHHSNGQGGPTSRSWNRIYADAQFVHDAWRFNVKPWIRIREKEQDDDNRDIQDFFGRYELQASYAFSRRQAISVMLRNAFDRDDRYNAELNWSFPIGKYRGIFQVYSGYAENLIDYNYKVNRLGLGILLSDL